LHTFREKLNQKNSTHYSRAAPAGHKGAAPNRFVRVAGDIRLTQPTQQIAASKDSGKWPACLVTDSGRNDRLEGAILRVSAITSQISDAPGLDDAANLIFTWWMKEDGV